LPDALAISGFPPTQSTALLKVCHAFVDDAANTAPVCSEVPLPKNGAAAAIPITVASYPYSTAALDLNISIDITLLATSGGTPSLGSSVILQDLLLFKYRGIRPCHLATTARGRASAEWQLRPTIGTPLLTLAPKYRRLMVAPHSELSTVGSFVSVDHRRRALRANGALLITQGYYFYGFVELWRGNCTLEQALDDLTGLSQQGGKSCNNL
jgi:hypothetical protein